MSLQGLGQLAAWEEGKLEEAHTLLAEAQKLWKKIDLKERLATCQALLARVLEGLADYPGALGCARSALLIRVERKDERGYPDLYEGIASVQAQLRRPRRAVALFGAAARRREEFGRSLSPRRQADVNRWVESLRTLMGPQAYDRAWARGGSMTDEEAIAEAMADGSD